MAKITQTGVEVKTLEQWTQTITDDVFVSVFGSNFNTDPETKQGQIIANLAFSLTQLDQQALDTFNATCAPTAKSQQLDNIFANLGIKRKKAIPTEVIVTLGGLPNTILSSGIRAKDVNGNIFYLDETVTIGVTGTVEGVMIAADTGPIEVKAGELDQVVDNIAGWDTVTNASPGITGVDAQSDVKFYADSIDRVMINSLGQVESIKALLLNLASVQDALVVDNELSTDKVIAGVTVPPKKIVCIVLGGGDQEIVDTIGVKKPAGVGTFGDLSRIYTYNQQVNPQTIYFYRATPVEIEIQLTISTFLGFPSNGITLIKNALVDYVNDRYRIADDVIYSRLYTPINSVSGFEVDNLIIGVKGQTLGSDDITINLNQISSLVADDIVVFLS